jgi:predicted Zn finger-like uncharacterized protein
MHTFVPCPHCHAKLQVPENLIGRKIRCPACKNITVAPTLADSSPLPDSAQDGAESIMVTCPRCAAWITVPAQQLGHSVTCGKCLEVVPTSLPSASSARPVAAPGAAPAPAAPPASTGDRTAPLPPSQPGGEGAPQREAVQPGPALSPDFDEPGGKRDTRKRKKKKKKRSSSGAPKIAIDFGVFKPILILGVLGLVVFGLIFVLRSMFEKGGAPPTIPPDAWQAYDVKDRLTSQLPVPFRRTQQDLRVLGGDAVIHVESSWPEREQAHNAIYTQWYGIGYTANALPAAQRGVPEKDLLNRICDDLAANAKASGDEEVKRRSIQLDSYPGMELTMAVRHGKTVTRFYLAHHRIYLVAAGGRGIEPNQPNVKRLFESLQIVDTGKDSEPPKPKKDSEPPKPKKKG